MINFIGICKDFNIPYYTEGKNCSPGFINVRCPFCHDHSNHLGFNIESGRMKCWKCGGHGLRSYLYVMGVQINLEDYMVETQVLGNLEDKNAPIYAKKEITLPGEAFTSLHKIYLRGRNYDPNVFESKYGCTGTTVSGFYRSVTGDLLDFRYRIILPIVLDGKLVSFTGRSISENEDLRYKTLDKTDELIHHKHIVFNADNATRKRVLITEGPLDVYRIGDNCIGTFGISFTPEQVRFIASRWTEVFVLYDKEPRAQIQAEKLCNELSALNVNACIVDAGLPDESDPGKMSPSEVKELKEYLNI